MKNKFTYLAMMTGLVLMASCQEVDPLEGTELGSMGITSVTAAFTGELYESDPSAAFPATPDANGRIHIEVPYYYPQSSDNEVSEDLLKKMRVTASLVNGTYIEPGLGVLDMTQVHTFTAYDAAGRSITYELSAAITKLSGCEFSAFAVTSQEAVYTGIINTTSKTISLMFLDDVMTDCSFTYTASPHATVSGLAEGMSLKDGDKVTVTAHNGVDKTEYTIRFTIPEKISYGARIGSQRNIWKKFYSALGITTSAPIRLAASGDNLYVLTGGAIYVLDKSTGDYIGTADIPSGYTVNSMVSDEAGNILFAADAAWGGQFTVYAMSSITDTPRVLCTYTSGDGTSTGLGNIRVTGDITGNAVVTANHAGGSHAGLGVAWQITGGVAGEPVPISLGLSASLWNGYNGCIVGASGNLSDGVFGMGYWTTYNLAYSTDFTTSTLLDVVLSNGNENNNCLSTVTFNGARYLAAGAGAHFTWGTCPLFNVYDSSNPAVLANAALYCVPYTDLRVEGGFLGTGATSDVLLVVSEDGYYMDAYFTDGNYGLITCYEFDCIEQ